MLTLNEEFNLPGAIDNIKNWAEEIFIVDSCSFDRTVDIALENGESWNICCRSTFEGDAPDSYKDYAKGTDPRHYYLRMPTKLAKLLDGMRATIVVQSAKTLRMIYNTCGMFAMNGESMTR